MFELHFYKEEFIWGQKLVPIQTSEKRSHKTIDLVFFENPYVLI